MVGNRRVRKAISAMKGRHAPTCTAAASIWGGRDRTAAAKMFARLNLHERASVEGGWGGRRRQSHHVSAGSCSPSCHFRSAAVGSASTSPRTSRILGICAGGRSPSHLSLSSSFFRSFMSRCTTFRTCSASSSVRADRSSLRPIAPGLATLEGWVEEGSLLIWGPGLGQPWMRGQKDGKNKYSCTGSGVWVRLGGFMRITASVPSSRNRRQARRNLTVQITPQRLLLQLTCKNRNGAAPAARLERGL